MWLDASAVWLEPPAVWLELSTIWLESSAVWLEPSTVWLESSAVWLEPSTVWLESSAVWLEPVAVRLEASGVWLEPAGGPGNDLLVPQTEPKLRKNSGPRRWPAIPQRHDFFAVALAKNFRLLPAPGKT